jgi:hypothetical protein
VDEGELQQAKLEAFDLQMLTPGPR